MSNDQDFYIPSDINWERTKDRVINTLMTIQQYNVDTIKNILKLSRWTRNDSETDQLAQQIMSVDRRSSPQAYSDILGTTKDKNMSMFLNDVLNVLRRYNSFVDGIKQLILTSTGEVRYMYSFLYNIDGETTRWLFNQFIQFVQNKPTDKERIKYSDVQKFFRQEVIREKLRFRIVSGRDSGSLMVVSGIKLPSKYRGDHVGFNYFTISKKLKDKICDADAEKVGNNVIQIRDRGNVYNVTLFWFNQDTVNDGFVQYVEHVNLTPVDMRRVIEPQTQPPPQPSFFSKVGGAVSGAVGAVGGGLTRAVGAVGSGLTRAVGGVSGGAVGGVSDGVVDDVSDDVVGDVSIDDVKQLPRLFWMNPFSVYIMRHIYDHLVKPLDVQTYLFNMLVERETRIDLFIKHLSQLLYVKVDDDQSGVDDHLMDRVIKHGLEDPNDLHRAKLFEVEFRRQYDRMTDIRRFTELGVDTKNKTFVNIFGVERLVDPITLREEMYDNDFIDLETGYKINPLVQEYIDIIADTTEPKTTFQKNISEIDNTDQSKLSVCYRCNKEYPRGMKSVHPKTKNIINFCSIKCFEEN